MIINGIEFPNKIIKSIENKSLVVFVGAGVSMGAPTCLPSFDKLAEDIACGTTYVKKNNEPCDVFLGRVKFGKIDVNEIAAEMLSRLDLKPNKLHEYLINLFNEDEQIKIVTTNYDQMLEIAAKSLCRDTKTYDAPALPLGNDIHGIIHLHGNISNPNYMVITDSDFGRAYMVNGYASRFLVELFAKYTVLFVGYSYNDVIMRYLTRAMVNDGESNRYILTDDNQSEWAQLGLNPIIYPSEDYDSLYSGIKHLGEIVNRQPSEWKRVLDDVASCPPLDYALESEIEYCLEDEHKRRLFAESVHGEDWMWWLDKRHVFDRIFSRTASILEEDSLWLGWITKEFACKESEAIQQMIIKHNAYNVELANRAYHSLVFCFDNVSNRQLFSMVELFKEDLCDKWIIYRLIEEFVKRGFIIGAWDIYKKYFNSKVVPKKSWISLSDASLEYSIVYIGDEHSVKTSWEKLEKEIVQLLSEEILDFGKRTILEVHDKYYYLGLANDEKEPWEMMEIPIEDKNRRPYSDDILLILIDSIEKGIAEIEEKRPVYAKEYILSCLDSRSVLLRKLGLRLMRNNSLFSADEIFELIHNRFDLFSQTYKEQIFLDIAYIFNDISEVNQEKIFEIIESGKETGHAESDAYSIYNWCVWIDKKCGNYKRINDIVENVKTKYSYFAPRDNPEMSIVFSDVKFGDESPKTEKELLQMEINELIRFLSDYQNDSFDGPNRDGLLSVFSNCIKDNYQWIKDLIPYLMDSFEWNSDIWPRVLGSITYSEMRPNQKYEILCMLSTHDFLNLYYRNISQLIEKIVEKSEKEELKKYEIIIWEISNYILHEIEVEKEEYNGRTIDLSLNMASSLCISSMIRFYEVSDDEEGEKYLLLFEEMLNSKRSDRNELICVIAGQFNYFFNRNKKWCIENILPLLSNSDIDVFSSAWEGYVFFSGRLYLGDEPIIQKMYLDAVEKVGWLSKEAKHRFIELYAVLVTWAIDEPIKEYIAKLLVNISDEERTVFAQTINRIIENMSDDEINNLWDKWLNTYIYNRSHNIPVAFGDKELVEMGEWIFNLKNHKLQYLNLISIVKICSSDCTLLLFRIKDEDWYKSNLVVTKEILLWILDSENIPNYIYDEIYHLKKLLEIEGIDCSQLQEKMIGQGRANG